MAQRGTVLSPIIQTRIARMAAGGTPLKAIARYLGVDRNTVRKYGRRQRPWQFHPPVE